VASESPDAAAHRRSRAEICPPTGPGEPQRDAARQSRRGVNISPPTWQPERRALCRHAPRWPWLIPAATHSEKRASFPAEMLECARACFTEQRPPSMERHAPSQSAAEPYACIGGLGSGQSTAGHAESRWRRPVDRPQSPPRRLFKLAQTHALFGRAAAVAGARPDRQGPARLRLASSRGELGSCHAVAPAHLLGQFVGAPQERAGSPIL